MGSKGHGGGQRGSEGPGRAIWVLKGLEGVSMDYTGPGRAVWIKGVPREPYGFQRSWKGYKDYGGPGRGVVGVLKVLEVLYGS